MRTRGTLTLAVLSGILLLGSARPVAAQDPERPLEVGLGYVFASSGGEGSWNYPLGFRVGVSRDLRRDEDRGIGVGAEYRYSYRNDDFFSESQSSILGGPKLTWRRSPLRPYVRGVAGLTWWRVGYDFENGETGSGTDTEGVFGVQGGVQLPFGNPEGSRPYAGISLLKRSYWDVEVEVGFDPFCPRCWLKWK